MANPLLVLDLGDTDQTVRRHRKLCGSLDYSVDPRKTVIMRGTLHLNDASKHFILQILECSLGHVVSSEVPQ